ncbi:lipid-binding start domain-containing protein [Pseudomonas sp. BAY1663]|uniref:START domain-containing protein n=1 Tax=Pseudomonas sp. BAY1663 TaxID=1439940 RepID=UPI00042DF6E5|nr:lipid-binding start domain-containing protein [Pseudomonas sp. BAY1663]
MGFKMRYLVAGMLCLASCWAQAADDWQLAKDENGIKVYLRAVPGSPYKAYRGVTVIDTDMQTLRRLMENAAEACAWIHECKEQKLLRHEERQAWTYTRFNTPWPVTPRDSVVHITEYEKRDGVIRRELEAVPDYLPEEDGYVRVTRVDGFWELVPREGKVEVTYQVHTEPGGSVPSWLANKFVVEAPYNTLRALRERAQ